MIIDSNFIDHSNDEIQLAHEILRWICIKTNIRVLNSLNRLSWANVYWKFESDQLTWSFKIRWAYYKLAKIRDRCKWVITASAGNHGLAVAEAWKILNVPTTICIPNNASTIKKERLSYYGHSIVQYGDSLEEATEYARSMADRSGLDFVSPFDDIDIIHWQGTLAIDILDEIKDVETLIIPMGWGWLVAWIALYVKKNYPHIRIVWVEPSNYKSIGDSVKNKGITRVLNMPTLADGLSVNLGTQSITFSIIQKLVDVILEASEEEIAAATLSILYHESKLVEPSGAIAISPVISGKIWWDFWKTVAIFSWWNISTSNLAKVANYPFKNHRVAQFTNYVYPTIENETKIRGGSFGKNQLDSSTQKIDDLKYDITFLEARFADINNRLQNLKGKISEYVLYCERKWLLIDQTALDKIKELIVLIEASLLKKQNIQLPKRDVLSYGRMVTHYLQEFRSCLHLLMTCEMLLDYRSASYDQSVTPMFFWLDAQESPNVNYNRYESKHASRLELQLSDVLWIDNSQCAATITSSGMAAFDLIENYLTKYVISPGDTILIPNYIYFESEEQVKKIPGINFVKGNSYNTRDIIQMILTTSAKVVLIDPLTNSLELNLIDLKTIVEEIAQKIDHKVYFVIDGTMLSWVLKPFDFARGDKVEILYYESCSKYLQFWMDISMWGIVISDVWLKNHFNRLRRNTWWIMYDNSVHMFPFFTREEHLSRMNRFTRNALLICNKINWQLELQWRVHAIFPWEKTHEWFKLSKDFSSLWWIVTFKFSNDFLNQRDVLNAFIERVIRNAAQRWISITKWVSFGFSLPRISAAAAMNELDPPFLRLSVWDRSAGETELMADVILLSLKEHLLINANIL